MLDLECTAKSAHNPAIIQIGAVHFDIDTGRELRSFTSRVNLQSSIDKGLVQDMDTLNFLMRKIPITLEKSKTCRTELPTALKSFSKWLEKRVNANERELLLATASIRLNF